MKQSQRWLLLTVLVLAAACTPTQEEVEDTGASAVLSRLTSLDGNEGNVVFSPDGTRIAFTSSQPGSSNIFVVSVDGGEPVQLTHTEAANGRQAWSPDAQTIAFQSNARGTFSIWIIPPSGGEARQLSDPAHDSTRPQWSPDGSEIAYNSNAAGSWDLWTVAVQTGETRQITTEPDTEAFFGWSPDGSELLYHSDASGNWDLWTVTVQTGDTRQLTDQAGDKDLFGWSPDGTMIGYRYTGPDDRDLYVVPAAGGESRNITNNPDEEWHPSWSADSKSVLFYTTWGEAMTDIWTVDVVSGELSQVTRHVGEDYGPRWSPDNRWIAFKSGRNDQKRSDLFLASARTGEITALGLAETLDPGLATWSPTGHHIAFSTNTEDNHIYSVPASGGLPRSSPSGGTSERLVSDGFGPVYSPDGTRIVFQSTRLGGENIITHTLETGETDALTDSYFIQGSSVWSPDGQEIAFVQNPGGGPRTRNLWSMSSDGHNPTQVTHTGGIRNAIWCGENFIFSYDEDVTYTYDIWQVPVAGGTPTPLVDEDVSHQPTDCSHDGQTLLFSGAGKIYSMPAAGDSYSEIRYREIENELGGGAGARWSPDGTRIAFLSNRNEEKTTDIYIMSAQGGAVTRLTNSRARESWPSWAADGESVIYSANMGNNDLWIADISAFPD